MPRTLQDVNCSLTGCGVKRANTTDDGHGMKSERDKDGSQVAEGFEEVREGVHVVISYYPGAYTSINDSRVVNEKNKSLAVFVTPLSSKGEGSDWRIVLSSLNPRQTPHT